MRYTVEPGLYALGSPGPESVVLVTANYKMSLDRLRKALPGRNAWILALDTQGINVWCAAGKGTFGTAELVGRITASGLPQVISHRKLILPQLAGPGIAAHQVKRLSGFQVVYGPIRSEDLPRFIDSGLKATPEMRQKTFRLRERFVLIPIELVTALKWSLIALPALLLLGGLGGPLGYWENARDHGLFAVIAFMSAILAGAVLTPLLLPWLPGRAFSLKGLGIGLFMALVLIAFRMDPSAAWGGRLEALAWFLMVPALAAFLAMNFTGASTYTSLSGVKKEMRSALPFQIGAGCAGFGLWIVSLFVL
jgi:acetyl-CoA decarbonylase/synthase complex subunit gamma